MSIDFALERIRGLEPDADSEVYLIEIAWLYDRIVRSGSTVPVIDLAYELVMPIDFVADCVSTAMDMRFICLPKKGSNGGLISQKALRRLKQVGNHMC
jgi:hypothetical protein